MMIQIYQSSNNRFNMNGDAILNPTKCEASFILNGAWYLELENPIDENINMLGVGAVISAPTPYGTNQLYRIVDCDKSDDSVILTAYPIFMDAKNDCFIWNTRPTNVTGKTALNQMLQSNPKYRASSNISKVSTAYYEQKNFIEALNGGDDNSFIKRWGGEIAYNNFEIIVNDRLGSDNGLRAEFGFNLMGVSEKVDMSNVVTRIIPKAFNGYVLPNHETVDSPNINKYPIIYQKVIEYQDIKLKEDSNETDIENGVIVCASLEQLYTALRKRAKEEFESGVDLPNIAYEVDMVDLSKTALYKNYQLLTTVNLGDSVHVKNRKLNIETTARVVEMTYDCLTREVIVLKLGDFEANYFNETSSITNAIVKVLDTSNNTIMAKRVAGVINLLTTSLRAQKNIAQRQDVRAILFEDLDSNSPTFGALCIGTQGIQISKERNPTNTDWQWGTAINFKSIIADYIIAGILTDREGKFYLNLDTGELRMRDGTFVGIITGSTIQGGTIEGATIKGSQIFSQRNREKTYTQNDAEKLKQYILGNTELTDDEKKHLDINQDGVVNMADNLLIRQLLGGSQSVTAQIKDTVRIHYEDSQIEVASSFHNTTTGRTISSSTVITGSGVSSDSVFSDDIYTSVVEFLNGSKDFGVSITLPEYSVNGVEKDIIAFTPTEKTGLPKYVINFTDRTAGFEG